MKMIFGVLMALILSASLSSFAKDQKKEAAMRKPNAASAFSCADNNGGADHGYSIYITKNQRRVLVKEITIVGAETVGILECSRNKARAAGADQMTETECKERYKGDAGYIVKISSGGVAGITTAELFESTIAGRQLLTNFICR